MTRQDFRCFACNFTQEFQVQFGVKQHPFCSHCQGEMTRFFGRTKPEEVLINYGYRESHYATETDARIAQYQFTHL